MIWNVSTSGKKMNYVLGIEVRLRWLDTHWYKLGIRTRYWHRLANISFCDIFISGNKIIVLAWGFVARKLMSRTRTIFPVYKFTTFNSLMTKAFGYNIFSYACWCEYYLLSFSFQVPPCSRSLSYLIITFLYLSCRVTIQTSYSFP